MDELDAKMDKQLQEKVDALHAKDDESGDGRIDLADLKLQLDRVEAQLALQDQQNRALLKGQRLRLWLAVALAVVLCCAVVFLWVRVDNAYNSILESTGEINALAGRLQESLTVLEDEDLAGMMEDLPVVTEKLSALDVDALNEVLVRLPGLMDTITELQTKVASLQTALEGLKNLPGSLGGLLGLGN